MPISTSTKGDRSRIDLLEKDWFGFKPVIAGGAAGLAVDCSLFPLDTIKTRLQSPKGFWQSGGFYGIYRGLSTAAMGSVPNAALFFFVYDTTKKAMTGFDSSRESALVHMPAAVFGEIAACVVRVPIEVIKQRQQVSKGKSFEGLVQEIMRKENVRGLYRGYFSTLIREIPFSLIQFPIWEKLKTVWAARQGLDTARPWQSALCGSLAGGIAAALTTPLDVAKTRIMLAQYNTREARGNITYVLKSVYREKGVDGLFAGVLPRTAWISIGGLIFFGTYEYIKSSL